MNVLLIKTPTGFAPADDEASDALKKFKLGSVSRLDIKQMRNYAFFKKWFALVKVGYDYFSEACEPTMYRGQTIRPEFERFRKDVTIMAGFYRPVWNLKGEMRIEAESISWASMDEQRFTQLYDATIRVLLDKVFNGQRVAKWTENELREVVEQIEQFQ